MRATLKYVFRANKIYFTYEISNSYVMECTDFLRSKSKLNFSINLVFFMA